MPSILDKPLSDFQQELTTRAYHCFRNDEIMTVKDLVMKTRFALQTIPNFGRGSLRKTERWLSDQEPPLRLGMTAEEIVAFEESSTAATAKCAEIPEARLRKIFSILTHLLVSNTRPDALHILLNRGLRPAQDDDPNVAIVMKLCNAASITDAEYQALLLPEIESALAKYFCVQKLTVTL